MIDVNDINPQVFMELVEKVDRLEKMMYNYDAKGVKRGILQGIKIQEVDENGVILSEIYKNNNGGLIEINDNNGQLNVKIGSENGSGGNIGGSIILFNDGGSNPRTEMGISITYDAGIINLRDTNGIARASLYADSNLGPVLALMDDGGSTKTSLTLNSGKINNQPIATQNYVDNAISSHESSYHSGL